jgi:transposase
LVAVVAVSWSAAGLIVDKIGDLHPEMRGITRHVFATMATFVGNSERDRTNPTCFASQATIAKRAGYSERAVRKAIAELEELGAITRSGFKVRTDEGDAHKTVRWMLTSLVALAARYADKGYPARDADKGEGTVATPARGAAKDPARGAAKDPARGAANPSDLQRPPGSAERGRSDAADAAAPPLGLRRDAAASPSMGSGVGTATGEPGSEDHPSGIIGEIMEGLGLSRAAAERWAERKVAAATGPVRNEVAFLRACLEKEMAEAASPSGSKAKTSTPGSAGGSARKGKGKRGKPPKGQPTAAQHRAAQRRRFTLEEKYEVINRVRAGTSANEEAETVGVTAQTIKSWVDHAESRVQIIVREADRGKELEWLASTWNVPVAEVQRVLAANGRDYSPEERAARSAAYKRERIVERAQGGWRLEDIAKQVGMALADVERVVAEAGEQAAGTVVPLKVMPVAAADESTVQIASREHQAVDNPRHRNLTAAEQRQAVEAVGAGEPVAAVAARWGRAPMTVERWVKKAEQEAPSQPQPPPSAPSTPWPQPPPPASSSQASPVVREPRVKPPVWHTGDSSTATAETRKSLLSWARPFHPEPITLASVQVIASRHKMPGSAVRRVLTSAGVAVQEPPW